jgi:hypothetical protein
MRKLAAFIVCGLTAILAGYTLLPMGFNALVDWLGPVFGLHLVFVFSSLFILFADPLQFTSVAILWVIVGLIGGVIIRRRIGSVATMLSVYSAQLSVLGLAAYGLFDVVRIRGILDSSGNILNLLPPAPQGATLATIMGAPVIGDIFAQLQSRSIASLDQGSMINVVLSTVILSVIKNLVILFVATLAGCEVGKLILRPLSPSTEAFRTWHRAVLKAFIGKPLLAALALLVLLSSLGAIVPVRASAGSYSETILATVTPQGTVVAAGIFFDTSEILRGLDLSNAAFNNTIGVALIAQGLELSAVTSDVSYLARQMGFSGVSLNEILRFYQLMPSTILVLLYRGDRTSQETAQSQADAAAALFGKKFGTAFTPLFPSCILPIGDAPARVFFYQSGLTFPDAANILVRELPETARGGLARYVGNVYRSGVLTPGRTSFSANGTVLLTGFINVEVMGQSGSGLQIPFLPSLRGKVSFWGFGSIFASRFHSSPVVIHELNIVDLFKTDEGLAFSTYSNASSIITFIPTGNRTTPSTPSSPIVSIDTTLDATAVGNLAKSLQNFTGPSKGQRPPVSLKVSSFSPGSTVDPRALSLTFTQRFPLQLRVLKSASQSQVEKGQRVSITVTVINDDSEAAENVRIDDSAWQRFYPSAVLVSGTTSTFYLYINGSSMVKLSYVILLQELGTYTLPAATVAYTCKGEAYAKQSNVLALQVPRPGPLNVPSEGTILAWNTLVSLLNTMPPIGGNGSPVLAGIMVGVVALIVFTQYRGYRKWQRGPR